MRRLLRFLIPLAALLLVALVGVWPVLASLSGARDWLRVPATGVLMAVLAAGAATYLRHIAALVIAHFNEVVEVFAGIGKRPMQADIVSSLARWSFLGVLREKDWALVLEYAQLVVWIVATAAAITSLGPAAAKLAMMAGLLDPAGQPFAGPLSWQDAVWAMPSFSLIGVLALLPDAGRVAVRSDEEIAKLMLAVLERFTEWRMAVKSALVTWTDRDFDAAIDMLRNALLEWMARRKRMGGGP